jgi:hypothetical protein
MGRVVSMRVVVAGAGADFTEAEVEQRQRFTVQDMAVVVEAEAVTLEVSTILQS